VTSTPPDSPPEWVLGGGGAPPPPRPGGRGGWRNNNWVIVVATVVACYVTGLTVTNLSGTAGPAGIWIDRLFPHIGSSRVDDSSLNSAWDIVRREYVFRNVDATAATQGAEAGIIQALHDNPKFNDKFSAFFTKDEYASLQNDLRGQRSGSIGIALEPRCTGAVICPAGSTPNVVAIEEVLRGQPADRAGLHNGDILIRVNGTDVQSLGTDANQRIDKLRTLVRGDAGTAVTLSVQRDAQVIDISVQRADLQIPSVYSQRFGSVLYVQITTFEEQTGSDFRKALQDGINQHLTSVVLDLRHNPGGLVTAAQSVASEFLVTGANERDVVVRRGRLDQNGDPNTAEKVEHDPITSGGIAPSLRLVVLVDGSSASASEIVTAALHDYKRGSVVGNKTFGKGSVQEDFTLPDGNDLHLTVERWFGPAGETIDGAGITPDQTVGIPDDDHRFRLDSQSADPAQDAQLQAALTAAQVTP
jgi:carboxyl-terminal processing protease